MPQEPGRPGRDGVTVRATFGPFELDVRAGQLRKHGVLLKLAGQPIEVLTVLLERPGELVTREELRRRLWRDETFVDFEHGLNAAVNKLRFALGDSAGRPRYIETVPRRGYRFVGSLAQADAAKGPAVPGPAPPRPARLESPGPPARRSSAARWIGAAALLALVAVLALGFWTPGGRSGAADTATRRTTLVVLPFENLSEDPGQDYFAEGLTDEMITLIGRLAPDRLGVIARTSASHYRGTRRRVREIAEELNVQYLVEGSVRREGARVRVSAQLIRAADEAHLWADSYDRDVRDLLSVQQDLARAIAARIELTLPALASRPARRQARPPAPEAYEAYLRGRYLLGRRTTGDALVKGHEYLKEAVRLDPDFALAHAGLSRSYQRLAGATAAPADAMPRALEAARRSLALDPELAEGHAALALLFGSYTWEWEAAEREFRRALDLNPASAETRIAYASHLSHVGRLEEAVAQAERALQLDPVSLAGRAQLAVILYRARRYEDALRELERVKELDGNYPITYLNEALVFAAQERYDQALASAERARELDPESLDLAAISGYVLGRAGDRPRAAAVLGELQARARSEFVHPWTLGLVHLGLGDTASAIDALERGYQQRSWMTALARVNPEFDPLRGDPRFEALLRRIAFPE